MTDTATAQPSDRSLSIMLWLVATGFFMQTLDSTIVNTALPAMAKSLGEAPLRMQGVVIAYSLTMAMMIPVSGWLADRLGTKRVFFSAILVFAVGSLLCANAQSLTQLVTYRVVQGVGAFETEDGGSTWTPRNQGLRRDWPPPENYDDVGFCVHKLTR